MIPVKQNKFSSTSGCICRHWVYLQESANGVVVVKVVPGSPAQKAGMQAGDLIIKVDDVDVSSAPLEVISSLLKGEEGTYVKVTVKRADKTLTFTIKGFA